MITLTIDFHVHCFAPQIAEKAIFQLKERAELEPLTDGLIETTVARFDEWGIERGVLLSVATRPTQVKVINDWCAENNGGRFISFGTIHPDFEDIPAELDRLVSLGLHGVKLHPDYQDFMVDEDRVDFLYDEIERRGLPVIFHAGFDVFSPDLVHCPPERALRMIKKHPHLKVILAHLGGNDSHQQVCDILAGIDGEVYFDTAFGRACPDDTALKIINKHGADRILFASDCPWDNAAEIKERILRLPISDDKKELILGKNAGRLLGLV